MTSSSATSWALCWHLSLCSLGQVSSLTRQNDGTWSIGPPNCAISALMKFEPLVGEVFRREGWNVQETGRVDAPDGNVDLVLTKADARVIVECKRWESRPVGVDTVRGFLGDAAARKPDWSVRHLRHPVDLHRSGPR